MCNRLKAARSIEEEEEEEEGEQWSDRDLCLFLCCTLICLLSWVLTRHMEKWFKSTPPVLPNASTIFLLLLLLFLCLLVAAPALGGRGTMAIKAKVGGMSSQFRWGEAGLILPSSAPPHCPHAVCHLKFLTSLAPDSRASPLPPVPAPPPPAP